MIALILLSALLFAPPKCMLSGTVVNSVTGEPVGKAGIFAQSRTTGGSPALTTTDEKGNFTLVDLEPDQYTLLARRNGYLDTHYGPGDRGTTIRLDAGGALSDIKLKLVPFGVIAGTVRDAGGEPISGVQISLFVSRYRKGRLEASGFSDAVPTDDLGQYRIAGLAPGRYYVSADPRGVSHPGDYPVDHSPKPNHRAEVLVPTFFPGVSDPAGAKTIDVAAGERVTGIDIVLVRTALYRISVHVDTPSGTQASAAINYSITGFGEPGARLGRSGKQDLEIVGVPPGSYILTAFAGSNVPNTRTQYWTARLPVQVAAADVEGLRIAVNPGFDVKGHVTVEGEPERRLPGAVAIFESADSDAGVARLAGDNTFEVRLGQGLYTPDLSQVIFATKYYVKSILAEERDVLRHGLALSGSGSVPLEIVLAADGGSIEGVVLDKDEKPVGGATIVLAPPAGLRDRRDAYKVTTADQNGHFQIAGIAPGESKLFAWREIEEERWLDPDFLKGFETKGEAVPIVARGSAAVTLHVLAQ